METIGLIQLKTAMVLYNGAISHCINNEEVERLLINSQTWLKEALF